MTDIQKTEIERRLAAYYKNRDAGDSWENVKDRILNPKRSPIDPVLLNYTGDSHLKSR
ncbi:addiction module protein [Candidatus Magnetobacterium casense]|uniref:Addiction module protein n=1 Tax=Candidatus Magnetobacterium casense TaxID=1455061 RepID=A0ABS6RZ74_9BACT|nr:addiction module protein [Candidatus Magnetobacterium casensis]